MPASTTKRNRQPRAKSGTSSQRSNAKRHLPSSLAEFKISLPLSLVALLVCCLLVAIAVLPTRTWLAQNKEFDTLGAELERINKEAALLETELAGLEDDSVIEAKARQDFDLVYPGEESYRILPSEQSKSQASTAR